MQLFEISERVHMLGNAWEQFKSINDQRLRDIERKGAADPLDGDKDRLARLEVSIARPGEIIDGSLIEGGAESEHTSAFCNYLRKGVDSNLQGYDSALVLFVMGATGDTVSGSIYWTLKLTEYDITGGTYTDVALADLHNAAATTVIDSNSAIKAPSSSSKPWPPKPVPIPTGPRSGLWH